MDITEKTKALRAEAWQALLATPAYRAFKGLDDAVKAMTGESIAPIDLVAIDKLRVVAARNRIVKTMTGIRITQGDVAARVLKRNGEPLPIGRWLEKCVEDGVNIKGDDPLPNFRSTVSRDKRFYAMTRNNMYFWWLTGEPLPSGWNDPADPDLLDESAGSSVHSSRKGGEGHESPATT